MEAIGELIGALFAAVFEILALAVELAVSLLALVAEFLFVMVTQGLAAAKERWSNSKSQLDQRRAVRKASREATDAVPISDGSVLLFVGLGALAVAVTGGVLWVSHTITQRRIETTRLQVAAYADEALANVAGDAGDKPVAGLQDSRDAWDVPLELFIDEGLLGVLVTVRSAGPDRHTGTIDDILALRTQHAGAGEVGRELGRRAIDKAQVKAAELLGHFRKPEHQQGQDPQKQDDPPVVDQVAGE